ncbi:hypothetical protein AAFF_G00243140 [Aldrovandia affinis]|uniref:Uncharacterized protein n=1 Tax=Aldrovandia affinis TaxID=143900 RepID=A0AAD7RE24_9TELE|nr:hypothetical protein AAFF_G00243140 [Aldrovandia affinis]
MGFLFMLLLRMFLLSGTEGDQPPSKQHINMSLNSIAYRLSEGDPPLSKQHTNTSPDSATYPSSTTNTTKPYSTSCSQDIERTSTMLYGIIGILIIINTCLLFIVAKVKLGQPNVSGAATNESANNTQMRATRSTSSIRANDPMFFLHPSPNSGSIQDDSSSTSSAGSDSSSLHEHPGVDKNTSLKATSTKKDYVNISPGGVAFGANCLYLPQGGVIASHRRMHTEDDYVNVVAQDSMDSESDEGPEECVRVGNAAGNKADSDSDESSVNYTAIVFK